MKRKIFFIFATLIIISLSLYRYIDLNKSIYNLNKNRYKEEKYNNYFNINGVDFKLDKNICMNNSDKKSQILKSYISLKKNGNIDKDRFSQAFPSCMSNLISLNVVDKSGNLIENYSPNFEEYEKDNPKFIEIQKKQRTIGSQRESLVLTFEIDNEIIKNIDDGKYKMRMVFPLDNNDIKFDYINMH